MKNFLLLVFLLPISNSMAQQWLGATTSTGAIYRQGNIGINNASPTFALDMMLTSPFQGIQLYQSNNKWIRLYAPSLGGMSFNNITVANDAGIIFGSTDINAVDYGFVIAPHRGSYGGLRVTPIGDVGIGVSDTKGYRLAVGGKIIGEEVVVKLQASWPDYVFESTYKALSLTDLEKFILANKHLPEIPSADEVAQNGVTLGEMNVLLLKKIEELTLYIIEQQKRISSLEEKVNTIVK